MAPRVWGGGGGWLRRPALCCTPRTPVGQAVLLLLLCASRAPPGHGQGGCAYTAQGCDPGHAWSIDASACEACPAGKQSSGAIGERCEACPHSLELIPVGGGSAAFGAGCRCRSHHTNPWPVVSSAMTSCLACSGAARMEGDDYRRVSCEPCADAAGGGEDCIGARTCECGGGELGQALLCAAEGHYLLVDPEKEADAGRIAQTTRANRTQQMLAVHAAYKLMRCRTRGGLQSSSRCLHWRQCRPEPNATCRPTAHALAGVGEYHAAECCAEGYRGPLCEHCSADRVHYNGSCLVCEGPDWKKLLSGVVLCFFFVAYVMQSTIATFDDASGKAAIVVFFMQTAALILLNRLPDSDTIGNFLHSAANLMNLNFLKPGAFFGGDQTCVLPGNFYSQWVFGMVGVPAVLMVVYSVSILLAHLFSEEKIIQHAVRLKLRQVTSRKIILKALTSQPMFDNLSDEELQHYANRIPLREIEGGQDIVHQGDSIVREDEQEFYVIVSGRCAVKVTGDRKRILEKGESFGEIALLNHEQYRTATVTALDEGVEVGVVSAEIFHEVVAKLGEHEHLQRNISDAKIKGGGHVHLSRTFDEELRARKRKNLVAEARESTKSLDAPAILPIEEEDDLTLSESNASDGGSGFDQETVGSGGGGGAGGGGGRGSSSGRGPGDVAAVVPSRTKVEELEHIAMHAMKVQYSLLHSKASNQDKVKKAQAEELREVSINSKCCGGCCIHFAFWLKKTTAHDLHGFFKACHNPVARKCGILEISIALYGPLTQDLMSIFICNPSPVDSTVQVLAVDPTVRCDGDEYAVAFGCAAFVTPLVVLGVPLAMNWAATSFKRMFGDDNVENSSGLMAWCNGLSHDEELYQNAQRWAEFHFVSSWSSFDEERKKIEIDKAMQELQIDYMQQECFLLSKFQMAMSKNSEGWYPQWYMLRRLLINVVYLRSKSSGFDASGGGAGGSSGGGGGTGQGTIYDWRVASMLLLATSSVLQYHFHPFRRDSENRLEMWALQLLTIMIMVDYADQTQSGAATISILFLTMTLVMLVGREYRVRRSRTLAAEKGWNFIRSMNYLEAAAASTAADSAISGARGGGGGEGTVEETQNPVASPMADAEADEIDGNII